MKNRTPDVLCPRVLFALLLLFIQASCASPPVRTEPAPEKSDYSPIKVFTLDFSSAWETTLRGLQEKGIPVGTQDREKGIIRTNFQDGSEMRHLGKIYSARYKYNIFLFREGDRKTILNVRCQYEGKEKGGLVFFDGSYLFPGQVAALENRMYETIESYFLPLQASRAAEAGTGGPQTEAKRVSAGPAPAGQVPSPEPARVQGTPPPPSSPGPPPLPKDPERPPKPLPGNRAAAKSLPGGAAPAVPPKAANFGTFVTKKEANLREGPSLKSKIVLRLKKATKLEKVGQSGTWIKVKVWEKTIGWVSQELLQEVP